MLTARKKPTPWTGTGDVAAEHGFIVDWGLRVVGIEDPIEGHLYAVGFVFLGDQ
ncbi:hypothetical protein ABZX95_40570 [Streptomyces sp. NPDC004232]|uniref:hypothetical protein n=1 Tax=Streptomyces sp. NPDC004232 TaxID=3154454 RepID=UPI001D5F347C|nr:hypothetical protein [Streptomyces sp. tea 10]